MGGESLKGASPANPPPRPLPPAAFLSSPQLGCPCPGGPREDGTSPGPWALLPILRWLSCRSALSPLAPPGGGAGGGSHPQAVCVWGGAVWAGGGVGAPGAGFGTAKSKPFWEAA